MNICNVHNDLQVCVCSLFTDRIHFFLLPKVKIIRVGYAFFSKECNVLAFFYILLKRTKCSLRSFEKKSNVPWVLLCSFEKNATFLTFFYVLFKRMQSSLRSFEKNAKE